MRGDSEPIPSLFLMSSFVVFGVELGGLYGCVFWKTPTRNLPCENTIKDNDNSTDFKVQDISDLSCCVINDKKGLFASPPVGCIVNYHVPKFCILTV